MKTTYKWTINPNQHGPSWRKGVVLLLSSLLAGSLSPLLAQVPGTGNGVAAPTGDYQSAPDIVAPSGTYSTPAAAFAPTTAPNIAPFVQGGHLPVLLIATVSEVYDDNIFIQPSKTSDFITQIGLVGEYKIGNDKAADSGYFNLFYAPTDDIYADHSAQDSFNQTVGALFQYRFSKLTLALSQTYAHQSAAAATAGNLVTTDTYVTKASANYDYSDKFSIVGDFTQNIIDYDTAGYSFSNEWVGDLYFLYKVDPKLSLGFGPTFGWLDVGAAPNQTYQQMLGRVDYLYSGKLAFNLSAGAEVREYQGPVTGDTVAPVFSLSATWQPYIDTTFVLAGQRQYNPSYNLTGQDYLATSVSLRGRQRFCQKFYFDAAFGYENDDYQGAGIVVPGATRNDDYYFASTGVDWNPNSWLQASIYYKYQDDDSSFGGYSFNDNQVGITASFSY